MVKMIARQAVVKARRTILFYLLRANFCDKISQKLS